MQAEGAVAPEFHLHRGQQPAAPVRRARHRADPKLQREFRHALFQRQAVGQRTRLLASPSAQARAAVDQSRTQLQHTTVRAPFEAFVLRRLVEVGSGVSGVSQSTTGGSVLMTLGDARQSSLYAKATAVDAKRLRAGLTARVRLDCSNPVRPLRQAMM